MYVVSLDFFLCGDKKNSKEKVLKWFNKVNINIFI